MRTEGAGRKGSTLWLISRGSSVCTNHLLGALLVDGGRNGEALAVFGHEEEAEMFLRFWASRDGWRVQRGEERELAPSLRGPSWAGVRSVALDLIPGNLAGEAFDLLACMDRDRFAERLARDTRVAP